MKRVMVTKDWRHVVGAVLLLSAGLSLLSLLNSASALAQTSQDYYLHGSGGTANPPTLFLDTTAPTSGTAKYKDSVGVNFNGGNPWKEVGTWPTNPIPTSGTLVAVTPTTVWLGLKNSDDQGTNFDLLTELYKNGTLVSSGLNRCITGITRNPANALEVSVALSAPGSQSLNGSSDTLSLKVWTRIGTNPDDTKCAGHNNAVGLRLYFDATSRLSLVGLTITPNPIPTTLAPNPLTITVGATGTLTATIAPAPTADGTLAVSSANTSIVTVPATVAFVSGQTSVPIPVTAVAVGNTQITASLNGGSASATVQVTPAPPTITSLLPTSMNLTQGATGTLTVTISSAQLTDTVVTLSSTASGIASVPGTVTVPMGLTTAPITVTANTPGTAQITASLNGTSASSMVTVAPAQPTVVSLLPANNPVTLGGTVTLTVTISATQPTDTVIAVSASPAGIVTVPASVTVLAGQLSAPITVGTVALGTAMVHVSLNGSMAEAAVQVTTPPVAVVSLTPSPLTVVVNATGQLTVTLNAAQSTNTSVTLTVDTPSVLQVPASVTVPMNQLAATFTVTGLAVGDAIVTATVGSSSQSATVHVVPPPPVPLSLLPNPLPLQQGATGSLTLTISSAQVSDTAVPLTNSDATIIQVPGSVTVPAGQTTAAVPVTGLVPGSATVSATLNGTTVSSTVQVTEPPPVVTSLTPATLSLPKGKPGVLRVTVSRAPTEPTPVTLTSSAPAVATVPASVTIPAGALFADFPVMSLSEGTATITASLNGGSATATVTVTPPEVVSLTLTPTNPSLYVGESQPFTAMGTYTDGTTQNLTNTVTWTSATETVATINSGGVATALAVGTTVITASYTNPSGPPAVTASTTLTVLTPPQMQLIPASASLQVGETLSLTLDAGAPANAGGLTVTLTSSGSGSVTHPATVTIPEGDTQIPFTVTGATLGSVTLTASAIGRLSATATLTVFNPIPVPTITSFTPIQGRVDTIVTITGANFDTNPSGNQITFNGMSATVLSATATQLVTKVPLNATTGKIFVTTAGGTAQSTTDFTVVTLTSLLVSPPIATLPIGESQQLHVTAVFSDQSTQDVTDLLSWTSSAPGAASVTGTGLTQSVAQGTATITGTLNALSVATQVQVTAAEGTPLPPDPVTVAPPVTKTVATALTDATTFLYTGANPIQTGVTAGTIVTTRAAVLRGVVTGRDGFPIPNVTVTVFNHPEFGQTRTRADGFFDLVVNGGGLLTVKYDKAGYLPAQRQVSVPWQEYALVPDVVLIPLDPVVTTVTAGSGVMQTARGSVVTDADGTRQATALFPSGTTATMTLPGGGTQPLSTLNVRATEYTVGTTGQKAMAALLPPTSGYTYAAEFSVDEALAAGATSVTFSQPVIVYVENFLNVNVGTDVPLGFYDRQQSQWKPSPDGRVVKIISITGGLADVDTDGNGTADNGLGITTAERQLLATLYAAGQSLSRLPIPHFTLWDGNWPFGLPVDAIAAALPAILGDPHCENCDQEGSIIRVEDQALGESASLTGTPYRLHYQSDRAIGRRSAYRLPIPLSGASLPASLRRIELDILVAGRLFTQTFPPTPNQSFTFQWDGIDVYGRAVQGRQPVRVRVGYTYGVVYKPPAVLEASFAGYPSSGPAITTNAARFEQTLVTEATGVLGAWDSQADALGGWSLNVHHGYDIVGRTLFLGTGARRFTEALGQTIATVAGNGLDGFQPDGGQATGTAIFFPEGIAPAPDGSFYYSDFGNNRIRKVSPAGIVTTVAGTGNGAFNGNGIPATSANIGNVEGIALGPDGSLYIGDNQNKRIRRVDLNGIITTIAGNGTIGSGGDGGPATSAQFSSIRDIAAAADGSVYVADSGNGNIRRIGSDGVITTVFVISQPRGLAVGPDGSVYITVLANHTVYRLRPDGAILAVAGNGTNGFSGDGGLALSAQLSQPFDVAVGADGSLYIAEQNNNRIRRVGPDKIITTFAGDGLTGFAGDNGLAPAARFNLPHALAVGNDGGLYISDNTNKRIRRIAPALPGLGIGEFVLAAEDGSELYVFDVQGRHLRTQDPLTNAVRLTFAYDTAGRLSTITDVDGKVTTIERNGSGTATAIVAPGGQQTALVVGADGLLTTLTDPASQTTSFTYAVDGLLASLTDPRGSVHRYTYDSQGRLIKDEDAATGFKALTRTDQSNGHTVSVSTALNRTTSYKIENLANTDLRRTFTDPNGLVTVSVRKFNGTTTITAPDGTITTPVEGPDARFSMQAPVQKSITVQTPLALISTITNTRSVTLSNPLDSLSLSTQTDTLNINGRTYTSVFNQSTKTITMTTPQGRTRTATLDVKGRLVQEVVAGLDAFSYTYDAQGRLSTITQGNGGTARTTILTYNSKNELVSILDPENRTVNYAYDLAGRLSVQTMPDLRQITYAYDGNGNVTNITPPGRPQHQFNYTPVDLESNYNPPDAGFSPRNTQYTYNLDRQLTLVTKPDGQTIQLGYEPTGGRLSTLTLPGAQTITYAYEPTKGTLTSITGSDSTISFTYDGSLPKQTTWSGAVAGSVSGNYDNNFRITSQSVNGGNTVAFGYDNDSLLISAGAETIARQANNGLSSGTTLGVVTDSRIYNSFGDLATYTANVSSSPVLSATYTNDRLGRITQKVETIQGVTDTYDYVYDPAGRLQEVRKNGGTLATYVYDSNGNRLSRTDSFGAINGTYDAQDRQLTYGNFSFIYTTNGELLTKTMSGQITNYTYDVLGNLKSVTLPDNTLIQYLVDGQNRRIGKKVNGVLTQGLLYENQLNPVTELDGTGAISARFVYGTRDNVPDFLIKGGVTYRIISDHLGSPRLVIDSTNGSIVQRMDYDEFGNVLLDTNPGFQPFGYAGGLYDQHTGLTRFGARDYDAVTGRWLAKDPIDFDGGDTNLYGYVDNNPINEIDPLGLGSFLTCVRDCVKKDPRLPSFQSKHAQCTGAVRACVASGGPLISKLACPAVFIVCRLNVDPEFLTKVVYPCIQECREPDKPCGG